jgi:transposase
MLIGRCAWHTQYHGYPRWHGVMSWRGFRIRFTDGICPRCLDRFRREHRSRLARPPGTTAAAIRREEIAS